MKKIFSLLLAVTFVVSAFCIPVSATYADQSSTAYIQYGTSAHDLQAYGLHTFLAYKVSTAPSLTDGGILDGEYEVSDVAKLGDGLTLTNSTGTTDYTEEYGADYQDVTVTSYLAYDDEYIYIAEKVVSPVEFSLVTNDGVTYDTLLTNVRYGLNQSTAIPEAVSRLSNTYAFVPTSGNYEVSGCIAGNRTYKAIDGTVSKTVTLDDEYYSTWNLEKYGKNAAVNFTENAGSFTYEFEYRIPLADAVYSAAGSFDTAKLAELLAKSEFFGSYLFQIAVTRTGGANGSTQMYLTTGYAGDREIYPYASSGSEGEATTWAKAVKDYWTNTKGEALSVVYVPSPVLHSAAPDASVPSSTGFRPGLTGYGLDQVASVYKAGEVATFTVIPDAIENTTPSVGDVRVVPTKFRIRSGYDTKITGTFAADFKTGQFQTSGLSMGVHTLVVTFTQQKFDGTNWVDTSITKNLSRNFTVAGSVLGASGGSAQTGDSLTVLLTASGVMLFAAAAFTAVVLKKKKSR